MCEWERERESVLGKGVTLATVAGGRERGSDGGVLGRPTGGTFQAERKASSSTWVWGKEVRAAGAEWEGVRGSEGPQSLEGLWLSL